MRDGLINSVAFALAGLTGIFLVPILLHGLGLPTYGVWLALMSATALLTVFDLGLSVAVKRKVSGSPALLPESNYFLASAASAFICLGIGGGAVLIAFGPLVVGPSSRSGAAGDVVLGVYVCAAAGLLCTQLLTFFDAVFQGLGRFDAAGAVSVATALLRAATMVVVIVLGGRLLALAVSYALASFLSVALAWIVLKRLLPHLQLRAVWPGAGTLGDSVRLDLPSQLTMFLTRIIWDSWPLLIGALAGSGAAAIFHVGQRLPRVVYDLFWRMADAIFPRASREQSDQAATRRTLEAGTRWICTVALPLCTVLFVLAPQLLRLWIGQALPEATQIARLMCLVVLVHAFAAPSLEMLWARGKTIVLVKTLLLVAILFGLGTILLIPRLGLAAVAWSLLLANLVGSALLVVTMAREAACPVSQLLLDLKQLLLPVSAGALSAYLVVQLLPERGLVTVVALVVAAAVGLTSFLLFTAREEDRILIRSLARIPVDILGHLAPGGGLR